MVITFRMVLMRMVMVIGVMMMKGDDGGVGDGHEDGKAHNEIGGEDKDAW